MWKARFIKLASRFDEHKAGIQHDLQIHASVTMSFMSDDVTELKSMVRMISLAFQYLLSPEEEALKAFTEKNGGRDAVAGNDALLSKALAMSKRREDGDDGDDRMTVLKMREELKKDVDQVLRENAIAFENKFQLMHKEIDGVKSAITHESDRIIEVVKAAQGGPHEYIIDRVSPCAQWLTRILLIHLILGCLPCVDRECELLSS